MKPDKFNVRVYGIWLKDHHVLLVKENVNGLEFTKFPGGGLEFGEGLMDALIREVDEELGMEATITEHFYTTDFFQQSAFYKNEQLISVYYLIDIPLASTETFPLQRNLPESHSIYFYLKKLDDLHEDDVTFPIDKLMIRKLKSRMEGH